MKDMTEFAQDIKILIIVFSSIAIISFILCFSVLIIFFCQKRLRSTMLKLIAILSTVTLLFEVTLLLSLYFLQLPNDKFAEQQHNLLICPIQGVATTTLDLISILLLLSISFTIFKLLHTGTMDDCTVYKLISISFILPFLIAIYQSILFAVETDEEKCYIPQPFCSFPKDGTIVIGITYGLSVIAIIANSVLVYKVYTFLSEKINEIGEPSMVVNVIDRLKWYPLFSIFDSFPAILRRVLEIIILKQNESLIDVSVIFYIACWQCCMMAMKGIILFGLFVKDEKVQSEIKCMWNKELEQKYDEVYDVHSEW